MEKTKNPALGTKFLGGNAGSAHQKVSLFSTHQEKILFSLQKINPQKSFNCFVMITEFLQATNGYSLCFQKIWFLTVKLDSFGRLHT